MTILRSRVNYLKSVLRPKTQTSRFPMTNGDGKSYELIHYREVDEQMQPTHKHGNSTQMTQSNKKFPRSNATVS